MIDPYKNLIIWRAKGMYETLFFTLLGEDSNGVEWTIRNNVLSYTIWDSEQACEIITEFLDLK